MTEIDDKTLESRLNALNVILEKSYQGKELWDEGEKLFAQITLHRIPTFPRDHSSKFPWLKFIRYILYP